MSRSKGVGQHRWWQIFRSGLSLQSKPTAIERGLDAAGYDVKMTRTAAISTGRRNTLSELLCWRLILQGLAGAFVKLPCDCAEIQIICIPVHHLSSVLYRRRDLSDWAETRMRKNTSGN
jgi:hypothetical protein